jgi:transcriptional regulator of heat shock response
MDKRKELILNTIIKEHIKTGAPVGSSILVEKYKLKISPATARNEMAELENDGYIIQPHTSAGRIPTEKAYRLFLEKSELLENGFNKKKNKYDFNELEKVLNTTDEASLKEASKLISAISEGAVFWAFHRHNLYYTGISNLFHQPEFSQMETIYDISTVIDQMDIIIDSIFEKTDEGIEVLIGSENPFGSICAVVLLKYKTVDRTGMLGILGPMRMNYEKNINIVKFVNENLRK